MLRSKLIMGIYKYAIRRLSTAWSFQTENCLNNFTKEPKLYANK